MKKYDVSVLAIFKNEDSMLKEWLEHYLNRNFDHIYLLNDRSTDNSEEIIRSFPKEKITLKSTSEEDSLIKEHWRQQHLYNKHYGYCLEETKWLGVFDLDEFCYSPQETDFKKLLSSYEGRFKEIIAEWYWFGSNGFEEQPKSIVESFSRRSKWLSRFIPQKDDVSKMGYDSKWCCKSFALTDHVKSIRHHRNCFNFEYDPKGPRTFSFNASAEGTMFINHYIGSKKHYFENKVKRGSCNNNEIIAQNKASLYKLINLNEVEDKRLAQQNKEILRKSKLILIQPNVERTIEKSVCIIQNTHYHFETAISLYKMFEGFGFDVVFYRCEDSRNQDEFDQESFLKKYKVKTVGLDAINRRSIGVVVSVYPSSATNDVLPNQEDEIFSILDKFLYTSHRFNREQDYSGFINKKNCFCLSPLSSAIQVDHIWLLDSVIKPKLVFDKEVLRLTIQGHFELSNRCRNILEFIEQKDKKILAFNIFGTNTESFLLDIRRIRNVRNKAVLVYESLSETDFYEIINESTMFLIPAINGEVKNGTYLKDRYSSNFNLAYSLEKPIFAHEVFRDTYKIPGFYYEEHNIADRLEMMSRVKEEEYISLVESFATLKEQHRKHNAEVILKKIMSL